MKRIRIIAAALLLTVAQTFAGPLDPPDPSLQKYRISGRVIQRMADSALVQCERSDSFGYKRAEGLVLVRGECAANDGAKVKLLGVRDGTFEYTTVLGARKIIDAFKLIK